MNNTITELNRRNAETFNLVIRQQNDKINSLQQEIDGLKNMLSGLIDQVNSQQEFINLQRIKQMGNGPS